jgi:hypothetical protein
MRRRPTNCATRTLSIEEEDTCMSYEEEAYQLRYKNTEYCSWVGSGPKCFQVLGLSPSLLQNPMFFE